MSIKTIFFEKVDVGAHIKKYSFNNTITILFIDLKLSILGNSA